MKSLLFASAALLLVSATPSLARDYSVCSQIYGFGQNGVLRCDFINFQQCRATVSGQAGTCIQNPAMAYGQMPERRLRAQRSHY